MFAALGELLDGVVRAVDQPDRAVLAPAHSVSAREVAFSERTYEVTVFVENDDRVLAPAEHVNLIVVIYGDRADLFELPAVRKLAPTFDQFVAVVAAAYGYCHLMPFRIVAAGELAYPSGPPAGRVYPYNARYARVCQFFMLSTPSPS